MGNSSSGPNREGPNELDHNVVDIQKMKISENSLNRKKVFKKYAKKKQILPRFENPKSKKVPTKGLRSDKLILKYVGKSLNKRKTR